MFRNSFFFYFRTKKDIIQKINDLTYFTDTIQVRNCPVTLDTYNSYILENKNYNQRKKTS